MRPSTVSKRIIGFNNPDLKTAKLNTNMQATVMVAVLINPEKPSCGDKTALTMNKDIISIEVVSIEKYSFTNKNIPSNIIAMVITSSYDKPV